ncbi:MAG: CBS domain-containing protein [Rhodocyclaceae bacterium]|nr:CBS domain-containing protein [Rhodocyclaceae bacterium]
MTEVTPPAATAAPTAPDLLAATVTDFLNRFPPYNRMEAKARTWLARNLQLAFYPRGSDIITPEMGAPKHFHIVLRGKVHARQAGATAVTEYAMVPLGPGEGFPIGSIAAQRASTNAYVAVEDTYLYQLPADAFMKLMLMSQVFHLHCTQYIADLLIQARQQLQTTFSQRAAEQQTMITPLGELLKREAVFVGPETPVRSALETMAAQRIGCMMVADDQGRPLGILTQSDILPRIVLPGFDLARPIREVMTTEPFSMPETASAYDATLEMAAHKLRHMLVVNSEGRLTGVVSERDLFSLQRISLRQVRASIEGASSIDALQRASKDIRQLALNLVAQGIAAEQLTRFISSLNDALTRRIIEIEIERHNLHGLDYAWLAFGSEGRHEQTLSTDQDNGLIYVVPEGEDKEAFKARLLKFARDVNECLAACGFPLCTGNIMASNPDLCLTWEQWQHRFSDWIREPDPQALLNATIFFDFRVLSGNEQYGDTLRAWLNKVASANSSFLMMMSANALQASPPLGRIRDFLVDDDGTIDLKKSGARLFVDVARILALRTGVGPSSTVQRLRIAGTRLGIHREELSAIIDGFHFIQLLRLRTQHIDTEHGSPGDNRIRPEGLNELDRRILKESFRQARKLQLRLKLDYQL